LPEMGHALEDTSCTHHFPWNITWSWGNHVHRYLPRKRTLSWGQHFHQSPELKNSMTFVNSWSMIVTWHFWNSFLSCFFKTKFAISTTRFWLIFLSTVTICPLYYEILNMLIDLLIDMRLWEEC
jgi:hypothetical protein